MNRGEQDVPLISQDVSHVQNKSSSLVSGPPTSSTVEEERGLSQQTTPQFVSRNELQRDATGASTDSRILRPTLTGNTELNNEHSAAGSDVPIQESLNSSRPDQSATNLLPLDDQAVSRFKPASNAPRLPYPDVGGLFHEGWDDQRETTASQIATWQHSQSPTTPETSNNMPHKSVDTEQPQSVSQNDNFEQIDQFSSKPNQSLTDEPSPDQATILTTQPSSLTDDHAQNPKHRPFSFMELTSHKNHEPVQEILQHARSKEAKPSGDRYERDPSPVSPQRSLQDLRNQHSHTSDDFLPSEKQLELATQSSPYHFQDPNLHEHPAFRHGAPSVNTSSRNTDQVLTVKPHPIYGVQQQQFPPAVPPHGIIGNSWRNPSDPPFLPALSAPEKAEEPKPIRGPGYEDSKYKAPASPKTKPKRASLFRSLNGRSGKDHASGRDTQEITASPPATRTEPNKVPSHHENTQVNIRLSESSKAPSKLQRSSISAIPEQDLGKKRRFSLLGVS